MLDQINTILDTLKQIGAEPLLISLQIKDYYDFCLELSEATGDRMVYTTINNYLNVKIYKNIDVPESVVLSEYSSFLMVWPINQKTLLLIDKQEYAEISPTMKSGYTGDYVKKEINRRQNLFKPDSNSSN